MRPRLVILLFVAVSSGVVAGFVGQATAGKPRAAVVRVAKFVYGPCPIPAEFRPAFERASREAHLPLALLAAVANVESEFRPDARSPAGAHGLLQVLPSTAKELKLDTSTPENNVLAGARYLRILLDRFKATDLALAAYNAGPTAVEKAGGAPNDASVAYVERGDAPLEVPERLPVAVVVLAAGAATRFGAPKQQLCSREVLDRVRSSAEIGEIVVVAGAYELEHRRARRRAAPDWERGPGASLRCGLDALGPDAGGGGRPARRRARPVAGGDRPGRRRLARGRGRRVVAASYGGVARAPGRARPRRSGRASRTRARARSTRVLVPCDDLGAPGDVDRPEDLPERLR